MATDIDQNQDGNDIGNHLDQLDGIVWKLESQHLWKIVVQPVEHTEHISAPDDVLGLPGGEDDQRNGKPAKSLYGVRCRPSRITIVHDVIYTAESGDSGAQAGSQIFVTSDINTGSISGRGIFTYCTKVQACARPINEIVQYGGDQYCKVHHEPIREKHFAKPAQMCAEVGDRFGKYFMSKGCFDGSTAVENKDTKEVCHTCTEDRQSKTGNVLVCTQCDRQQAVDQTAERCGDKAAEKRDQDDQQYRWVGDTVLIEVGTGKSGETAQHHNTGDAEVQVAGTFCNDLTGGAEHDNCTEPDGAVNPRD